MNYSEWTDEALEVESERLIKQANRENMGEFFRNEKSRKTYNIYLQVETEIGRRRSAIRLKEQEIKEIEKQKERIKGILSRRPKDPTLEDIDKTATIPTTAILHKYSNGYRVLNYPSPKYTKWGTNTGKINNYYVLEEFDTELWFWKQVSRYSASRAPIKEFNRLSKEEPVDQEDIDFWSIVVEENKKKYL